MWWELRDDGQEAWTRLGHRRAEPLAALADIAGLRRLLDRMELEAVRAARRERRSWAEIATRLGVARQSAWERWRDVDDEPPGVDETPPRADDAGATSTLVEDVDETLTSLEDTTAPLDIVVVPSVVGLSWSAAQRRLLEFHLHAVSSDPQLTALVGPDAIDVIVLDQKPSAGESTPAMSAVTLWLRRGPGSAGLPAPLPPPHDPYAARGRVDEETGLSVRP